MAYFLAYLALFFALGEKEGLWLLATAVLATLALAVSIHGKAPLWSRDFMVSVARVLLLLLVLWVLYQVLLLVGIDVTTDLVHRS